MNACVEKSIFDVSDKEIVKGLKSKNEFDIETAYEDLYNKYSKLVFVCIYNIVKNREDTEDLLADTFLKIFENRERLIEEKNLKYYIVTTAKNTSLTFVTKKQIDATSFDEAYFDDIESDTCGINDMIDEMKRYLDDLEIKIIVNHLVYALTFEEIGDHLNMSPNSVKTLYYRSLKKVK